jgi:hypothetical protein
MDKEKIQEKILRWQLLADKYSETGANVFIKTLNENYYFCNIVLVGETTIMVDCYGPPQRKGKREIIEWLQIDTFELELKEERE